MDTRDGVSSPLPQQPAGVAPAGDEHPAARSGVLSHGVSPSTRSVSSRERSSEGRAPSAGPAGRPPVNPASAYRLISVIRLCSCKYSMGIAARAPGSKGLAGVRGGKSGGWCEPRFGGAVFVACRRT
jgi:hypothetical protein